MLVVCVMLGQRAGRGVGPPGVQTAQQQRPGIVGWHRGGQIGDAVRHRFPQLGVHIGAESLSECRIVAPLLGNHADVVQDQAACFGLGELLGCPCLKAAVIGEGVAGQDPRKASVAAVASVGRQGLQREVGCLRVAGGGDVDEVRCRPRPAERGPRGEAVTAASLALQAGTARRRPAGCRVAAGAGRPAAAA